jgi:hypothetical protein
VPSLDLLTYPSPALVSPPFPTRPSIPAPIDSRSEGFSMADNQNRRSLRVLEKRAKQNLRMSLMIIVRHLAMIADWRDV